MTSTALTIPPPSGDETTPFGRLRVAARALQERAMRMHTDRRTRLLAAEATPGMWAIMMVGLAIVGVRCTWDELVGQVIEVEPSDGIWRAVLEAPYAVDFGGPITVDALRERARGALRDHTLLTLRREGSKAPGDAIDVDPWELMAALVDLPPALGLRLAIVGAEGCWRRFFRATATVEAWGAIAVPEMPRESGRDQQRLPGVDADGAAARPAAAPALARTAPAFHRVARGVEVCRG